ncbi:MAG: SDR family oxidoreductase [Candidatus Kapabacteria bacterium]|nr:SDR family oxidoreductase [Candidatus Kapabacteria bacterium]
MITIVGAGSSLAGALIPLLIDETDEPLHLISGRALPFEDEKIQTSIIDVLDKNALKTSIMEAMPNTIINCAAMTSVDRCETERNMAWSVNVTLVENLTRMARIVDARIVQVSTDYVFDGLKGPYAEGAIANPINYYGKSKLAGEIVCLSGSNAAAVVRTNVLYGTSKERPDFVRWVLDALDAGTPVRVVNDQYSNPTYIEDLADAISRIVMRKRSGLFHVGGADYVSRFDFAVKIAEFFKGDVSLIRAVTTAELGQAARRPLRGGLVPLKTETDLKMKMRGIESGLSSVRHAMLSK